MNTPKKEIIKELQKKNKKYGNVNEIEVRELELYTENDGAIYRQRLVPIYKNLARKKTKKIYNHTMAIKLMTHAVNDANKKYKKEYGISFSTSVRYQVAKNMVKIFEGEYRYNKGNY